MSIHDKLHASEHTDGTDDIQDATAGQKGLATATQITKLDGIDAGADVTADNAPQAHAASHTDGSDDIQAAGAAQKGVITTGAQTIAGEKTFSTFPLTPSAAPDADYEVANKKYVDDNGGGGGVLQALSDTCTSTTTSSGSFVDVSGLSVDITVTTGKVVVLFNTVWYADSTSIVPNIRLMRDSAPLIAGTQTTSSANANRAFCHIYLDNPGSGTYTYKVQWKLNSGTGILGLIGAPTYLMLLEV